MGGVRDARADEWAGPHIYRRVAADRRAPPRRTQSVAASGTCFSERSRARPRTVPGVGHAPAGAERGRVIPAPCPDPSPAAGQRAPRAGHQVRAGGRRRRGQEQPHRQLHLQWVPGSLPAHGIGHLLRYVQWPRRPHGWGRSARGG